MSGNYKCVGFATEKVSPVLATPLALNQLRSFVVLALVAIQSNLPICAANPTTATIQTKAVTTGQRPTTRSAASTSQVPDWWRRNWALRKARERHDAWLQTREARDSTKAMWNPRSPDAIAYRRIYYATHRYLQAPSTSRSAAGAASRQSNRSPSPTAR
jgi:hypothetical protein